MKQIIFTDGTEQEALEVFGGKEQYQNARREYLEFVFPREGHTVEELEELFSAENCRLVTLEDPESGERFVHEGYVVRGPVRVYRDENGTWKIGVKRYQQTDMEMRLAALEAVVAALIPPRQGESEAEANGDT